VERGARKVNEKSFMVFINTEGGMDAFELSREDIEEVIALSAGRWGGTDYKRYGKQAVEWSLTSVVGDMFRWGCGYLVDTTGGNIQESQ
jgi:hypothetical protein